MRSPAEPRRALEWALRAALLGLLALALWRSLHPPVRASRTVSTDVRGVARALGEASRSTRVAALEVAVDSLPGRPVLAWLRALRGAGVRVAWHGTVPALALEVERTREPDARVRIVAVADSGDALSLADAAGPLDSLRVRGGGGALELASLVGGVRAGRGRFVAAATPAVGRAPRAVVVLGRAGWESRFVTAALQEAGWTVRARQPVAPGVVVADADLLPVDTGRYAVVVALDSTARELSPALLRFVAQGGGLVLAGEAIALPGLGALAPARASARRPGRILLDADSVTRADLPLRPLVALRDDAVRLETGPAGVAAAVRRAGQGRVLAIGYDESWRWRMLGGAGGPDAHRAWWSRTVGLVAPATDTVASQPEAAPMAAIAEALGPATPASRGEERAATGGERLPLLLLALAIGALLAETASRRFRGAR